VAVSLLGATTAIRGPEPMATGVAAHLIVQLATSHPPTDLHIVGSGGGGRLSWIGWLPHRVPVAGSDPIRMRVIDGRALPVQPPGAREAHLLVLAGGEEPPPWVDTTVVVATDGTGVIERRTGATEPGGPRTVMAAPLRAVDAARAARHLARWRPVAHDDPVRQPGAVIGLDQLIGPLDHVGALLDRWALDPEAGGIGGLGAPVGMQASGPFTIDLVRDGPHAVIGGTTGSGKSELLRTLVASICAGHPPESVIFVLVDYKGGSAFDGCAGLPHVTTVVTDLDGSRTARVLTAVDAELTRRERWLRQHHRSDLDGAAGLAGRPPRLVVAIDEFATLARDQPDFLPALVDVARRGRSLGLHLVLATQRPAGAMTDDMRANIDLRIALRMVDATDSTDVIGAADAARIPADRPGQAAMRRGGGPVEGFQAATATSGPSSDHEAALDVRWIPDPGADPRPGPPAAASPSPLQRLESTARAAMARSGRSPARPIWPPELPTELSPLDLDEDVPGGERGRLGRRHRAGDPDTDAPAWATVGWADDLTAIRHQPCDWAPARGALALSGTHGSDMAGVITGVVAAVHRQLGPCHVYAADGTGELDGWAGSDPVAAVVRAEARDGMRRLVDRLERELRRRDRKPGLHLVLLAVHHHPAVAGALDDLDGLRLLDRLHRIVAEGPEHGIASIVSTPRPGVLPTVLGGAAARRLVLHLADADDYRLVGLRPPTSPLAPGRALDERGMDVQLARLEPAHLAPVTTAATIDRPRRLAPLPTVVPARPGPTDSGRDPWLLPVGVDHDGPVAIALSRGSATVVAGPPGSGRTTALQTIATGAEQRGTQVLTVHPADGLAEGPRADTVDELGRLLAVISGRRRDSGEPAAERSSARPGPARRLLIVIDDATELEDPDGTLAAMVRGRLRPAAVRLVLAVDPLDARAAYGHWTASVRRGRCGIALHHDPDEDRDLWALPLPPAPTERRPPGRGLLLRDGEDAVEIQVARP
jgi:S-DNA-T family DNA segregation ATPase FtsK/SpoIIIE